MASSPSALRQACVLGSLSTGKQDRREPGSPTTCPKMSHPLGERMRKRRREMMVGPSPTMMAPAVVGSVTRRT